MTGTDTPTAVRWRPDQRCERKTQHRDPDLNQRIRRRGTTERRGSRKNNEREGVCDVRIEGSNRQQILKGIKTQNLGRAVKDDNRTTTMSGVGILVGDSTR